MLVNKVPPLSQTGLFHDDAGYHLQVYQYTILHNTYRGAFFFFFFQEVNRVQRLIL
jgi:hypothetical protein